MSFSPSPAATRNGPHERARARLDGWRGASFASRSDSGLGCTGDCLARTLRLLGHRVITDNHIGDWGTQFGKLIVGWKRHLDSAALEGDPIAEMERLYKLINSAKPVLTAKLS